MGGAQPSALISISVVVQNVAGECLHIDVERSRSSVLHLKDRIAELWQVPSLCQVLLLGPSLLHDTHDLAQFCREANDTLVVTLVVSLDLVKGMLIRGSDIDQQLVALEALSMLRSKGGEQAISAIVSCLSDPEPRVRHAAIRTLGKVAETGHEFAITIACECLEDPDVHVRYATLDTLVAVAPDGDEHATSMICRRLDHPNSHTRQAAVEALRRLTGRGNPQAIAALHKLLRHPKEDIRITALWAMTEVANIEDDSIVAAVRTCTEDSNADVRHVAVEVLAKMAKEGDEAVLASILVRLRDDSAGVREVAIQALAALALASDLRTIEAASTCLQDGSSSVRRASVAALVKLMQKGNEQALVPLMACLEDIDLGVKFAAIRAMATITRKGDPRVLLAANDQLEHPSVDTRLAAVEALTAVALKGDASAIHAIAARLEDSESSIRRAAVGALRQVTDKGDDCAIAAVRSRLDHPDVQVRMTALEALSEVDLSRGRTIRNGNHSIGKVLLSCGNSVSLTKEAQAKDLHTLDAVVARLEDTETCVRQAAAKALSELVGKGDANAIHAVIAKLSHSDAAVRQASIDALQKLADKGDQRAIVALGALLEHNDTSVRESAIHALGILGDKGDKNILDAVTSRMQHPEEFVRRTAINALGALVTKGDDHVISAVGTYLVHSDACVRETALEAWAVVASMDDICAVGIAASFLEDPEPRVRCMAGTTLQKFAMLGSEQASIEAAARLEHSNQAVKQAAIEALSGMPGNCLGDSCSVVEVLTRTRDHRPSVRQAAIQALSTMADSDSTRVVLALASCLEDVHADVRNSAIDALASVVEIGDARAIMAVSARLEHPVYEVRDAATLALSRISERGDARVITSVCAYLEHADAAIHRAAITALEKAVMSDRCDRHSPQRSLQHRLDILPQGEGAPQSHECSDPLEECCSAQCTDPGDACAIDAVASRLEHPVARVKQVAVIALGRLAPWSRSHGVSAVATYLKKQDALTKCAALKALAEVADKGNTSAIADASACLADPDYQVRQNALQALTTVAGRGNEYAASLASTYLSNSSADVRQIAAEALTMLLGEEQAISSRFWIIEAASALRAQDGGKETSGIAAIQQAEEERREYEDAEAADTDWEADDLETEEVPTNDAAEAASIIEQGHLACECAVIEDAAPRLEVEHLVQEAREVAQAAKHAVEKRLAADEAARAEEKSIVHDTAQFDAPETAEDRVAQEATVVGAAEASKLADEPPLSPEVTAAAEVAERLLERTEQLQTVLRLKKYMSQAAAVAAGDKAAEAAKKVEEVAVPETATHAELEHLSASDATGARQSRLQMCNSPADGDPDCAKVAQSARSAGEALERLALKASVASQLVADEQHAQEKNKAALAKCVQEECKARNVPGAMEIVKLVKRECPTAKTEEKRAALEAAEPACTYLVGASSSSHGGFAAAAGNSIASYTRTEEDWVAQDAAVADAAEASKPADELPLSLEVTAVAEVAEGYLEHPTQKLSVQAAAAATDSLLRLQKYMAEAELAEGEKAELNQVVQLVAKVVAAWGLEEHLSSEAAEAAKRAEKKHLIHKVVAAPDVPEGAQRLPEPACTHDHLSQEVARAEAAMYADSHLSATDATGARPPICQAGGDLECAKVEESRLVQEAADLVIAPGEDTQLASKATLMVAQSARNAGEALERLRSAGEALERLAQETSVASPLVANEQHAQEQNKAAVAKQIQEKRGALEAAQRGAETSFCLQALYLEPACTDLAEASSSADGGLAAAAGDGIANYTSEPHAASSSNISRASSCDADAIRSELTMSPQMSDLTVSPQNSTRQRACAAVVAAAGESVADDIAVKKAASIATAAVSGCQFGSTPCFRSSLDTPSPQVAGQSRNGHINGTTHQVGLHAAASQTRNRGDNLVRSLEALSVALQKRAEGISACNTLHPHHR